MLKQSLYLTTLIFTLGTPAYALNDIDTFITNHCGSVCNGESEDCRQCYNEAIDLHDQENPVSPEYNFDINDDYGKLKWVF